MSVGTTQASNCSSVIPFSLADSLSVVPFLCAFLAMAAALSYPTWRFKAEKREGHKMGARQRMNEALAAHEEREKKQNPGAANPDQEKPDKEQEESDSFKANTASERE